jgi:glutathione peroxidase
MEHDFYSFKAHMLNGKEVSMEEFRGKPLLIVNTASKCGFTPQYAGLEKLYKKYKDQGLVVIGFPCNQFGNQEPGTEKEIAELCEKNYGVSFPIFSKVEVNGPRAHPIFKYLQNKLPGFITNRLKWNFTKFFVDGNGRPVKRFAPITKPEKVDEFLEEYFRRKEV